MIMMNFVKNDSIVVKILEDFRYDLLKAFIILLILTATVLYSNTESSKYYNNSRQNLQVIEK